MFLFRRFIHEKSNASYLPPKKAFAIEFPTWKSLSCHVGLVNNLVWFWSVFG
uniref:Uncharacterized protein n=1 Tax=Setaria italica TaxID=4555 RepID=K4AHZ7_SETIT